MPTYVDEKRVVGGWTPDRGSKTAFMWIQDFENAMSRVVDAPDELLEGVAYWTAGAALASRVFNARMTTNEYLVLSAPAARFRKSTILGYGYRILRRVLSDDDFLPQDVSSEALSLELDAMAKSGKRHGVLIFDEIGTFLSMTSREYGGGLRSAILERFEGTIPSKVSRKADEGTRSYVIPSDFVMSFGATSTPQDLLRQLREGDAFRGTISRFLILDAKQRQRTYVWPRWMDDAGVEALAEGLRVARDRWGVGTQFRLSDAAFHLYRMIFEETERTLEKAPEIYAHLTARDMVHVRKLALIHAALVDREEASIEAEDIEVAYRIVTRYLEFATWLASRISM